MRGKETSGGEALPGWVNAARVPILVLLWLQVSALVSLSKLLTCHFCWMMGSSLTRVLVPYRPMA